MRIPDCPRFELKDFLVVVLQAIFCFNALAQQVENLNPLAVPTFHCASIYWSPENGNKDRLVKIRFRAQGETDWREGLPMKYNPIESDECKADYRGSIVNLKPATTYEIELRLQATEQQVNLTVSTWSEEFPIAETIVISSQSETLRVVQSGTADGYVLLDGTGTEIDLENLDDIGISVNASYVILRGFKIRNVRQHGIRIFEGHHIVIEDCDISGWGSESENGFGENYQACVYSNHKPLNTVVIQRCKFHHPTWDTNSWAEKHNDSTHPRGPQTIALWNSEGNHVFRYNECWSDGDHYFNDAMGAGGNGSYRGFPGADSDIYGNYVANCWDDGIEVEGGGQNVRVWNNYIEEVLCPIANAAVSIGPLYVWQNVSGRSHSPPGSEWDMTHGPFLKLGYADGEHWMTGHMYIFNNTMLQVAGEGAGGLGGNSRIVKHCTSRNNILHVRDGERSIAENESHLDNNFDFDLLSGRFPDGHEENGVQGEPIFEAHSGLNSSTLEGSFLLSPTSPGFQSGIRIPNFCEPKNGQKPDMGAHQTGLPNMRYGVRGSIAR